MTRREYRDGTIKSVVVRILQQQWVEVRDGRKHYLTPPDTEWRDVPEVSDE